MDIHQVSINYLHEQDRILVRINTRDDDEIRLWLTRRLCAGWIPVLRQTVVRQDSAPQTVPHAQSELIADNAPTTGGEADWRAEFKELQASSNFKTPFKADAKNWPLGTEPLLVTTVRLTGHPDGRLDIAFEEALLGQADKARAFQASIAPQLAAGFMHLLEQALDHTDWQMPLAPGNSGPGKPPRGLELNEPQHTDKPKYLH